MKEQERQEMIKSGEKVAQTIFLVALGLIGLKVDQETIRFMAD